MKKILKLLMVIGFIFTSTLDVSATPGRLKGASIEECGGVHYGHHGDGHWHEAKKNDGGTWSAIGQPLGFTSPCGTVNQKDEDYVVGSNNFSSGSSQKTEEHAPSVQSEPKESEVERKARIEKERIAEEERIKQAEIEKERIRKEKEAAEKKLKKESSIEISSISIGDNEYSKSEKNKIKPFVIHEAIAPVEINFKERIASSEINQDQSLDYFEYGLIDIVMASFNGRNTESLQVNILRLPTIETVQESKDFGIEINDRLLTHGNKSFKLSYKEYMHLNPKQLVFTYKETEVPLDYNITLVDEENSDKLLVVEFPDYNFEYEFPFAVTTRPINSLMVISSLGFGTLATGFFFFKKKK